MLVGGWLDRLSENIASLASLRVSPLGRVWQKWGWGWGEVTNIIQDVFQTV